ncbi:hypothetical protein PR048_031530 [Dryococelus australis]|uniref:Uncharacterized protein n=1 Tax=Dryococelus australis TaxID=614101 RepID=A0ABQ9G5I9_9NEOP|nr:hypothetical protein PR048_031530 [Dryococelus australis]
MVNRVQFPAGSVQIFARGNRAGRSTSRRVFSVISRFPRPFIPALLHTHLASPSSARPRCSEPLKSLHSLILVVWYAALQLEMRSNSLFVATSCSCLRQTFRFPRNKTQGTNISPSLSSHSKNVVPQYHISRHGDMTDKVLSEPGQIHGFLKVSRDQQRNSQFRLSKPKDGLKMLPSLVQVPYLGSRKLSENNKCKTERYQNNPSNSYTNNPARHDGTWLDFCGKNNSPMLCYGVCSLRLWHSRSTPYSLYECSTLRKLAAGQWFRDRPHHCHGVFFGAAVEVHLDWNSGAHFTIAFRQSYIIACDLSPFTLLGGKVLGCSSTAKGYRVQSPAGSLTDFSLVGIAPDDAIALRRCSILASFRSDRLSRPCC